jgi:hypothetical protein
MPPGHSSLDCYRWFTFAFIFAGLGLGAGLAQGHRTAPDDGLSGRVGVSYAVALAADAGRPLAGPIVRADLEYRAGDRLLTLRVDPIGLDRLDVAFDVREGSDLLSVTIARQPADADLAGRGGRTDMQVVGVRRTASGPTLQVLASGQHIDGDLGSATLLTRLALSDRIRDPGRLLSSFDWRASAQLQQVAVPAAGISRTTMTAAFGVGAALGGPNRRSWRPSLAVEASTAAAGTSGERLRIDVGLAGDPTPLETLTARYRWEHERPVGGAAPRTAQQQRLSLRSQRWAPLRLNADVDRRVNLAGETAWGWEAGAEATAFQRWTFGIAYRGSADDRASEHGARARIGVQLATADASLRAGVEGGAVWRSDDGWRPDASITLGAALRGDTAVTGAVAGSLRYGDSWTGTVSAEGALALGWADLDLAAEVAIADDVTVTGGALLAIAVFEPIAVQVGVDGQWIVGTGASASVDLGLSYRFGGSR